ncbi:hypothetical protein JNL27_11770 [bacterium]|nr:hypothetical protein [bacterium]
MASRLNLFLAAAIVVVMSSYCAGCDPFYSTDESYNFHTRPPETLASRVTDFGELKNGQHVAGYLEVSFTPDTLVDVIEGIGFCMDGDCDPYYYGGMGTIIRTIATATYPSGPHVLEFYVLLRDSVLGLGLIMGHYDTLSYKTTLIFDQTPPTKVDSVKAVKDGDSIRVSWQPVPDSNFYAYVVKSYVIASSQIIMTSNNLRSTDTIYDRVNTLFTDTAIDSIYGLSYVYQVENFNRVSTNLSDPAVYSFYPFGSYFWPFADGAIHVGPVFMPGKNEYLITYNDQIIKASYPENTILGSTSSIGNSRIAMNTNGSKMVNYIHPNLKVVTTSDMNLYSQIPFTAEQIINPDLEIVWGDSDRFVMDSFIVSVLENGITQKLPFPAIRTAKLPNSNIVYITSGYELATLDFNGDTVQIVDNQFTLPIFQFNADPSLNRLYVTYYADLQNIHVLETPGLTEVGQINLPSYGYSLVASQNGLFVSYAYTEAGTVIQGRVTRFDKQNLLPLNHYDFSYQGRIVLTPDGTSMYVFTLNPPIIINLGN